MSTPRHRRRERPAAAVVLLSVLGLLAASSPATANSYHDFLCRIPYGPSAGRAAPVDDVTYATAGTFVFAGNSCSGGGALYASMSGETSPALRHDRAEYVHRARRPDDLGLHALAL